MDLKYPIGHFHVEGEITSSAIKGWIKEMEELPELLRNAVKHLNDPQLDTAYRPEGWTIRQVIHHLADSHMNAYIRLKLALTEESPLVKTYEETKWAELPDYVLPIDSSLELLDAVHKHWTYLLHQLSPAEMQRTFTHPESGVVSIAKNIGIYAWHGKHHLAQMTTLCNRSRW